MEKRIQVSIRYKGKHFIIGNEFKTEQFEGSLTIGQQIGEYIDEQIEYLNEREQEDEDSN